MDVTTESGTPAEILAAQCPAPLQLTRTGFVSAPAETVFGIVSGQSHLCELIPGLQQVQMDFRCAGRVEGVGMVRRCDFGNDMWIRETVVLWQPPTIFAYQIAAPNPFGLTDHLAIVMCLPDQAATRLTWHQHYNHADLDAINALMASMMDSLLMNLDRCFQAYSV